MNTASIFETIMMICFGISWPINILKSIRSGTAKGKTPFFMCMIFLGYGCGIISKFSTGNITYVIYLYIVNMIMVGIDLLLYFRNHKLDLVRDAGACEEK